MARRHNSSELVIALCPLGTEPSGCVRQNPLLTVQPINLLQQSTAPARVSRLEGLEHTACYRRRICVIELVGLLLGERIQVPYQGAERPGMERSDNVGYNVCRQNCQ